MSTETDTQVVAEVRENFGKGYARRLRAAGGQIPAVIYGHGTDPVHVSLPGHQVSLLIRRANAVLELSVAGKQQLTLVKDVQKDPVHQVIEHIDLLVVKKGEKIQVDVPVVVVGEPFAGTIANLDNATVALEVEATHIPQNIEVDVEGLEDGTHHRGRPDAPQGATLATDAETLIVAISVPVAALEAEEEIAEADAEVAAEQSEAAEEAAEVSTAHARSPSPPCWEAGCVVTRRRRSGAGRGSWQRRGWSWGSGTPGALRGRGTTWARW
jgi:large subunit ribosomal protein L25